MDDPRLRLLRGMADAVARVVREAPPERFGVELGMGADGTPTKMVDDLAEKEILAHLKRSKAKLNLLSEEAGYVDLKGQKLLVADPIDGTTNAARGIPFYCVSLAIGKKDLSDVEAGIVLNLATGDKFEALAGKGATLNGKPLKVRAEDKELIVSSTLLTKGVHRSFGASALEMCLVASGALDCYHYPKPVLRIIDVAASTLIVREAGGVVLDRAGKDLELPLSLVPRFGLTAASSRELATKIGGAP
ncbi:MAG: inositol monophosphatase family protein [Candidatus Thermoplasmatota archaeon]